MEANIYRRDNGVKYKVISNRTGDEWKLGFKLVNEKIWRPSCIGAWRHTFEEAQEDLNRRADEMGWTECMN